MQTTIPLNKLEFGHNAPSAINARVAGREDGIDTLAANILARGLIEALIVEPEVGGIYYVANGNRRLAALRMMYGADSDEPIKCDVRDVDAAGAFEDSLTTAVLAHQLHPVDQYEAFAKLEERGSTMEEIARRYGMTEREVRQALALGRLSPKIREAWRAGEIKAETAQAFSLTVDLKLQDKIFAKLAKTNDLHVASVRQELGGKASDADGGLVAVVGVEAYEARGGRVMRDLFRERHIVSDPELLKVLVKEHLEKTCAALVAEGWAWASVPDDLPSSWRAWPTVRAAVGKFMTPEELERVAELTRQREAERNDPDGDYDEEERLDAAIAEIEAAVEPRCYSERQKAKLGCVVELERDGHMYRISTLYGVNRPAAAAKAAAADLEPDAPPARPKPAIAKASDAEDVSNALTQRLSTQLTEAARSALTQDVDLAISMLLAALDTRSFVEGVRASVSGLGAAKLDLLGGGSFKTNFELARELKSAERVSLLGLVAGAALDFRAHNGEADLMRGAISLICNAIAPKVFNAAMRGNFDAKDYFHSVPKPIVLLAIKEALGVDVARQQEKKQKPEVAAFAIANVPATGWLPPQLRAAGYDGPPIAKAKATSAAPNKKAAARPAKKAKAKPAAKTAKKAAAKKRKAA